MSEAKELRLNRIDMKTIFGFDLGNLLKNTDHEKFFNSLRGSDEWLKNIVEVINGQQQYGFESPYFAFSAYANTDRCERSTFSTYYRKNLMPLTFNIIDKEHLSLENNIKVEFKTIRIGINGAITLISELSYNNGNGLTCDTFINDYYTKFSSIIKNKACEKICEFAKILNSVFKKDSKFKKVLEFGIENDKLKQYIYSYDVIDFDYTISDEKNIHDLLNGDDDDLFKQLVRISRASLDNYKNHNPVRIKKKFLDDNIGHRKDELWLINEVRIVRHFPKKDSNETKKRFFEDVILGCEIFIQYKVAFLYINQWVITKWPKIKNGLTAKELGEPKTLIFEIFNFINIFSDDFYVQMSINHRFFSEIMEKLIKKLDLKLILDSNRYLLSSLFEQSFSISSIKLDERVEENNKTVKHLTVFMVILTVLMIFLTFAMIMMMHKTNTMGVSLNDAKTSCLCVSSNNKYE